MLTEFLWNSAYHPLEEGGGIYETQGPDGDHEARDEGVPSPMCGEMAR